MHIGKLVKYAVWFNSKSSDPKCKEYVMDMLWKKITADWTLISDKQDEGSPFECFFQIGPNFYLLFVESHWSPGDVSGSLMRLRQMQPKCVSEIDEVVAVPIAEDGYIPHQGLSDADRRRGELTTWLDQENIYRLTRP